MDWSNLSITSIGSYMFSQTALSSFVFPSTVTSIGSYAFGNTRLVSLTVPNSVTSIDSNAFYKVKNVIYNGSATGSPWGAVYINAYIDGDFMYTNSNKTELVGYIGSGTSVTIPSTVTTIGANAFVNCTTITSLTVPSSVATIGSGAFSGCSGLTSLDLRSTTITSVASSVFSQCSNITTVQLPSTLTSIGSNAFAYCYELNSLSIPNTVTTIGTYAFRYCYRHFTITLPSSMTTIGTYAFAECGITVDFSNANITTISDYAFGSNTMTAITIPNTVTTIGAYAFGNCESLTSITIPSSVTTISNNAFNGVFVETANVACNITSAANLGLVNNGVYYILNSKTTLSIHKGHDYTILNIPNQITAGNTFTVTQCNLSEESTLLSISLPDTVTTVYFYRCSNLNSVIVPRGVTTIGIYAFAHCGSLQYVYIPNTVTRCEDALFLFSNPLRIDCQATSKPSNWSSSWFSDANADNIHWGVQTPSI